MRLPLWAAGAVLTAAFLACSFDPTRTCEADGDCRNGGTCDPGTKTCVAAGGQTTPPTFVVETSGAPGRQTTTKLTVLDPGAPDAGAGAFRRDETVRVTVWSADSDVAPESVALSAVGIAGGAPAPPISVPLVTCAADNPAATKAFCRESAVSLGPPLKFDAFRGTVTFNATGVDTSGSSSTASTAVNVTRWKWRYAAGAPIYTTPAIADDGTIVFGTSNGANGSLFALTAEGAEKWPPLPLGPIRASPALGIAVSGSQPIYVGTARASGSFLHAIRLNDSGDAGTCVGSGSITSGYTGPFEGSPAVFNSTGLSGSYEGASAFSSTEQLVTIRPGAAGTADPVCLHTLSSVQQTFPENLVTSGSELYLSTKDGSVRAFVFDSGWSKNQAWGVGGGSLVGDTTVTPLAMDERVFGAVRTLGIFSLDRANGSLLGSYPDGGVQSDPGGPSISGGGLYFSDGASPAPAILVAASGLTSGNQASSSSGLLASAAVGVGGSVYTVSINGQIQDWSSSLVLTWSAPIELGGVQLLASPTIDCARTGGTPVSAKTGVLYAASVAGNAFAVIVDSPGLDTTAPWPKYQHDIRNTGNPNTPISSCP